MIVHQDQVAPNLKDVTHRFVSDWTDLDAGPTGGAGPDRFSRNCVVEHGLFTRLTGSDLRAFLIEEVTLIDLERSRRKHLASVVGRAGILAAIAHDAGVGVHQSFPRKVFQPGGAKLFD